MANIFSKLTLGQLELKNRIVMPPMCMYSAPDTGLATRWHTIHYGSRAVGGTGLIIVEATGVSPQGRITDGDLGIWSDEQVPGLSAIAEAIRSNGARAGIQINHAGRKCEVADLTIEGPSPLAYSPDYAQPQEMSRTDIEETVEAFRRAAIRADRAGFDLLQIHAAHGYLLSSFISPLTNKRKDDYGGSPENRIRLTEEVLIAVRSVWPADKPIEVRISAEDYGPGGNQAKDLALMINLIRDIGIDSLNVSTGGVIPVAPKAFPGYQIPHARLLKEETGLIVTGGGLITDARMANQLIEEEQVDLVFLGRELLRDPYWPLHAAETLGIQAQWPKPYHLAASKPRD